MRITALLPPPPTPMTLILQDGIALISIEAGRRSLFTKEDLTRAGSSPSRAPLLAWRLGAPAGIAGGVGDGAVGGDGCAAARPL